MAILHSAAAVLAVFVHQGRPMGVNDIALALKMPKSSVSRLLRQMADAGLLTRDAESLAYSPADMMVALGRFVLEHQPVIRRIESELSEAVALNGHTGFISVLDSTLHQVVVLRVLHGTQMLRIVTQAGKRNSAVSTSTGRALLARLSDERVAAAFGETLGMDASPQSRGLPWLLRSLAGVRRTGCAVALDEAFAHVGSVSCAVGEPSSGQSWAFCLSFPSVLAQEKSFVEDLSRQLVRSARRLGRSIGDPHWQ